MVSSFMPPHLGGLEVAAKAIFDAYLAAGLEARWLASRVPVTTVSHEDRRIRVSCWNGLERWLGVPWPVWGPAGIREVARLVQWADVLHVHDCLYLSSALTMLCAKQARKPVLLSQHIGFVRYPSALLNALERLAYDTLGRAVLRCASRVVFCNPAAAAFVTTLLGGSPVAAGTIPYGIDIGRFKPPTPVERATARRSLGLPASGQVVLFAGRLVEKKGVDVFLEVCRRRPSYHFCMVGDGPLRPGSAVNLTWIPFVIGERMEVVYQAADVLLLPSHSEGFPLAILEAMAVGLPVIVAQGEAFTTLLACEEACLAVERTPTALCGALDDLCSTPELVTALGARARQLVVRDYSLGAVGARYLALVRDLAGRS